MSYKQAKIDIESYFNTEIAILEPDLDIYYSNIAEDATLPSEYIRFIVQPNVSTQIEAGASAAFRFQGIIFIQVLVGRNKGENRANELIDECVGIFRRKVVEGIRFEGETIRNIDNNEAGLFQKNISIPFVRDEIYTI
jgi:hypothetical protein